MNTKVKKKNRWKGGSNHPIKHLMAMAQGNKCFYCYKTMERRAKNGRVNVRLLTIDHLVPRCDGGSAVMVAACWQCNHCKGDRQPSREELLNFRTIIQTSVYMVSARNFQTKALEEVNYWLKRYFGTVIIDEV